MHYSTLCSGLAFPAFILLGFLLSLGATTEIDEDQELEEKKILAWMIAQQQITSVSKSHLRSFKEISNPSEFSNASYQQLAGILPTKKKLMTIGLSSMQHPQGNYLMSTLKSLFLASSKDELKNVLVLVYLTVLDPTWFNETISDIVKTFSPQTLAGQLLVICSLSTPCPMRSLKTNVSQAYSNMVQFNQNVAHALLMNFAANLSNYFLMIEDNVHCLRNFITCIQREMVTWETDNWVLMEFSTWGFVGKLLHSSDLPQLAQFFFLYREVAPDVLLYHFRKLLDQNHPIQFSPSLFHQVGFSFNESSSNKSKYKKVKNKDREEPPNNPPATVYSNLRILNDVSPQKAYILGEKGFFWALEPKVGNHLTVVLAKAATVTRVQVLTGTDQENKEKLKDGKVELGYDPQGEPKACTHYILLGSLVNGKLDHKMLNKKTGKNVSCLKLVVSTSQHGKVMIKHINIWSKPEW
ncbi:alpha-1,3-mannosyl-glycoprotein 4-beta-N-acetylglucosaminyltransferase-like protein MGAT4E [Trichosurus vulpecula]|uniref:alpha-1,3-mannosyl-glycoprotein 4-beta-N-acetylglucosaminyltransferase-like protein MGAT4E n=1 Tax=Trichosurus vulpecula TaxID=9337 RepID=UPI00186B02D5|nr:alpha-1,3-mannosyl-glycoprotein 4-beta-N-acetylglucosaminyltransferase-like protein MGAT4E [Trichosurus vulpecula]